MQSRTRRRGRKAPTEPKRLSLREWQQGWISQDRTPKNGLKTTLNQVLKQDGTVGNRPGTTPYGPQPVGTVLGRITEFTRRSAGTSTNYLISMQLVAGVASVYYATGEDTTWTAAAGKTYDLTARAAFIPIRDIDDDYEDEDKVLVCNGVDNLSYFDINSLTVIPFTALLAPASPTTTAGAGVTGAGFPNRYRVTAGNRGETAASAADVETTTKLRSEWSGATEYVDVVITRVTGAERYHIYHGTEAGSEVYIGSVDDPGSGATVTWRDTGTSEPNIYRPAPEGDTTAGPICEDGGFINGQVFLVRDATNPKYVRYGGTGTAILDFSPYGGGGYEPVGGNKEIPVRVAAFRKNDGTPAITVLCQGTNGQGKRYTFSPSTVGNVSFFAISEENGTDGTEAPDSVITYDDQLWYLSSNGGKTTLTEAQLQTILKTKKTTDKIESEVRRFNSQSLPLSCGLAHDGRLHWAVAAGSSTNNEILVLDLNEQRRGAWMRWELAADWLFLYNDNDGATHFCALVNNTIVEFTDSVGTTDSGVAFPTGFTTGNMGASDDFMEWMQLLRVIFVLSRPQGAINVAISAKTEDQPIAPVGAESFTAETSVVGWGEAGWHNTMGWGVPITVPESFGIERTEIEIEVDEEVNWSNASVSTTTNATYEVTDIIYEYIETGVKR